MKKKVNVYLISLFAIVFLILFEWFLLKSSAGGDWIYYNSTTLRDSLLHFSWATNMV